jgi:hypothetical protein
MEPLSLNWCLIIGTFVFDGVDSSIVKKQIKTDSAHLAALLGLIFVLPTDVGSNRLPGIENKNRGWRIPRWRSYPITFQWSLQKDG